MPAKKPESIAMQHVCSQCGLAWEKHGKRPTLSTCIDLLREELAKRPQYSFTTSGAAGGARFTNANAA